MDQGSAPWRILDQADAPPDAPARGSSADRALSARPWLPAIGIAVAALLAVAAFLVAANGGPADDRRRRRRAVRVR